MAEMAAAIVLLTAGGLLYVAFRPRTLLLFSVADSLGLGTVIDQLRAMTAGIAVPPFAVYSLPGGLWAASYILAVDSIAWRQPWKGRLLAAAVIPLIGVASEVMQWAGMLPGKPDMADALCYAAPLLAYGGLCVSAFNNN